MLDREELIEECNKIIKQLERIYDIRCAMNTRIIRIGKYLDFEEHIDELRNALNELQYQVENLKWDLESEME